VQRLNALPQETPICSRKSQQSLSSRVFRSVVLCIPPCNATTYTPETFRMVFLPEKRDTAQAIQQHDDEATILSRAKYQPIVEVCGRYTEEITLAPTIVVD
jgi:hypothetical protein